MYKFGTFLESFKLPGGDTKQQTDSPQCITEMQAKVMGVSQRSSQKQMLDK